MGPLEQNSNQKKKIKDSYHNTSKSAAVPDFLHWKSPLVKLWLSKTAVQPAPCSVPWTTLLFGSCSEMFVQRPTFSRSQSKCNKELPKNVALPAREPRVTQWQKMAVLKKRARSKWKDFDLHFLIEWIKTLSFDPSKTCIVGAGLLFAEVVVNIVVIWKIKCKYHRAAFHFIYFFN